MNAQTSIPGNAPGLPQYISTVQDRVYRLVAMLEALGHLSNEDACENARVALGDMALEIANEIASALDSVNLPKVAA